jgi:hypothetical protein
MRGLAPRSIARSFDLMLAIFAFLARRRHGIAPGAKTANFFECRIVCAAGYTAAAARQVEAEDQEHDDRYWNDRIQHATNVLRCGIVSSEGKPWDARPIEWMQRGSSSANPGRRSWNNKNCERADVERRSGSDGDFRRGGRARKFANVCGRSTRSLLPGRQARARRPYARLRLVRSDRLPSRAVHPLALGSKRQRRADARIPKQSGAVSVSG